MAMIQGADILQYGALGLCAIMLIIFWSIQKASSRALDKKDEWIAQIVRDNHKFISDSTAAMNRMADALGDRPCLDHDSRVKNP